MPLPSPLFTRAARDNVERSHMADAHAPAVWQNAFEAVRRRWDDAASLFVIERRLMDPALYPCQPAPHNWDRWTRYMTTADAELAGRLFEEMVAEVETFWADFERAKQLAAENSFEDFASYRKGLLGTCLVTWGHPLRCEHAFIQNVEKRLRWQKQQAAINQGNAEFMKSVMRHFERKS